MRIVSGDYHFSNSFRGWALNNSEFSRCRVSGFPSRRRQSATTKVRPAISTPRISGRDSIPFWTVRYNIILRLPQTGQRRHRRKETIAEISGGVGGFGFGTHSTAPASSNSHGSAWPHNSPDGIGRCSSCPAGQEQHKDCGHEASEPLARVRLRLGNRMAMFLPELRPADAGAVTVEGAGARGLALGSGCMVCFPLFRTVSPLLRTYGRTD